MSLRSDYGLNTITDLPQDALYEIGKSCSLLGLFRTSKHYLPYRLDEYRRTLRLLLDLADLGEWDEAKAIWQACPDLLTYRGTVYHPNPVGITAEMNPGRYKYVDRSVFQIACMNSEFGVASEMGKVMSQEEKKKQFDEIFPDGKLIKYNWNFEEAKGLLLALFNEVIGDNVINEKNYDVMSVPTKTAWSALMNYVKPAPEHRMGLVFDARLYAEALKLYEQRFSELRTPARQSFWCVRVEELLAYLMGMCYLRAHTHGFRSYEIKGWFVVYEAEPALVPSGCQFRDGSQYLLFLRSPDSIPGYHIQVSAGGWPHNTANFDVWRNQEYGGGHPCRWHYYEKMIKKITRQGEELCEEIYKPVPKMSC